MPESALTISELPIDTIMLLTMYGALAIYAIFTGVFYYHWQSYGTNAKVTRLTYILYGVLTLPPAITLVVLALSF